MNTWTMVRSKKRNMLTCPPFCFVRFGNELAAKLPHFNLKENFNSFTTKEGSATVKS